MISALDVPRRAALRAFLCTTLLFGLLAGIWSFASPVSSYPDEPAHLGKAMASARGQWVGESSPGEVQNIRAFQLPEYALQLGGQQGCYQLRSDIPAECGTVFSEDDQPVVVTSSAGLYNPVYYVAVGWPSLFLEGEVAVLGMRLASAALSALLMGATAAMLVLLGAGRLVWIGLMGALSPMAVYLAGGVNPNGFEVPASLAFLTAGLAAIRVRDPRLPLAALAISGALLLNGRSINPLWAFVIAVTVLLLADGPRLRALLRMGWFWVAVVVLALASAFALWWTLTTGVLTEGVVFPGVGTPAVAGFFVMLGRTFSYYGSAVAQLGWLDVPAPELTILVFGAVAIALFAGVMAIGPWRSRAAVLWLTAASLLLPAVVQAMSVEQGGYIWQGRYILALIVASSVLAAIELDRGALADGRRLGDLPWPMPLALTVAVLLFAAHLSPFIMALKRYSIGITPSIIEMLRTPVWAPPFGIVPWAAAYVLALLAVAALSIRIAVTPAAPMRAREGFESVTAGR